jgi:DNA-binding MurR/RpiR family transcriptional regulator
MDPTFDERIRNERKRMSPSFVILADFLLDSYAQASFLTATELAHKLDLDPATVVRFAQKLGYPGYPELQREIRQKVKDELLAKPTAQVNSSEEAAEAAFSEIARHLDLTRKSFPVKTAEGLIAALDEAERVILLAEGLAVGPARSLASWLEAAGYVVNLPSVGFSEVARALVGARKKDLALAIEVVRETHLVARALAEAQKTGLRTAAFVAAPSSELALHADFIIAADAPAQAGIGQVVVEAMIHTMVKLLTRARPGRFEKLSKQIGDLTERISRSPE